MARSNNDELGARISSVFVVLLTSTLGVFTPILASKYSFIRLPPWAFFCAKYFGTGVIVATGFIHLLNSANKSFSNEVLDGRFTQYPWVYAIALMGLFGIFFGEICAHNYVDRKLQKELHCHLCLDLGPDAIYLKKDNESRLELGIPEEVNDKVDDLQSSTSKNSDQKNGCEIVNDCEESITTSLILKEKEDYYGQLISTFVLEFGIVFHSVFIGLTLAVSGEEFDTLYIVIVFHQTFEGLGLGTRVASTIWPEDKQWLPYVFGVCYALTTPLAVGMGLIARESYSPKSPAALITRGFCDGISSGILIYSGLVELMAHDFIFSDQFRKKGQLKNMLFAYFLVCLGCGLMALLAKWA